jgi:protein-tyrosine phosphatase
VNAEPPIRSAERQDNATTGAVDESGVGWLRTLAWLTDANFGTWRGAIRLLLGELEFASGRLSAFLQPDLEGAQRLVFVCLGNINRSAFAHVVAQSQGLRAASIGLSTTTGAPAYPMAVDVAPRYGLSLAAHRATNFADYAYVAGDLLLVMEVRHARELVRRGIPAHAITFLGHWARPHRIHIHDPHTLSETYFRTCFSILHSAVVNLADQVRQVQGASLERGA